MAACQAPAVFAHTRLGDTARLASLRAVGIVIGVAEDVKQSGVDEKTRSELYFFVGATGPLRAFRLFGTSADFI